MHNHAEGTCVVSRSEYHPMAIIDIGGSLTVMYPPTSLGFEHCCLMFVAIEIRHFQSRQISRFETFSPMDSRAYIFSAVG